MTVQLNNLTLNDAYNKQAAVYNVSFSAYFQDGLMKLATLLQANGFPNSTITILSVAGQDIDFKYCNAERRKDIMILCIACIMIAFLGFTSEFITEISGNMVLEDRKRSHKWRKFRLNWWLQHRESVNWGQKLLQDEARSRATYDDIDSNEEEIVAGRDMPTEDEKELWEELLRLYRENKGNSKKDTKPHPMRSIGMYVWFWGILFGTLNFCMWIFPHRPRFPQIGIYVEDGWNTFIFQQAAIINSTFSSMWTFIMGADTILEITLFAVAATAVQWPHPRRPRLEGVPDLQSCPGRAAEARALLERRRRREISKQGSARDRRGSDDSWIDPFDPEWSARSGQSFRDASSSEDETVTVAKTGCCATPKPAKQYVGRPVKWERTCLLIACHQSCSSPAERATFKNTLRSALRILPAKCIFVCDNGPWNAPVDDIENAAAEVHPQINYVFVPEGSKTMAFYWVSTYWIPHLIEQRKDMPEEYQLPDFDYILMIDDDVPIPRDLQIPPEFYKDDLIKACAFPITAAAEPHTSASGKLQEGDRNMLVKFQDMEYKMAGHVKILQVAICGSCVACHGAISLWKRTILQKILEKHDTMFHGEDLYMGITLLRSLKQQYITMAPQAIVPTYAPDWFGLLFKQRVRSWDLAAHRKTFTFIRELVRPSSFCHGPSLFFKLYFFQDILTIFLDWVRPFVLLWTILREPLTMILVFLFYTTISIIQCMVFNTEVLKFRPDYRVDLCTVILFPIYKWVGLWFRLCAAYCNALIYSQSAKKKTILRREVHYKDIPPVPLWTDRPDWHEVWLTAEEKDERFRAARREGLSKSFAD